MSKIFVATSGTSTDKYEHGLTPDGVNQVSIDLRPIVHRKVPKPSKVVIGHKKHHTTTHVLLRLDVTVTVQQVTLCESGSENSWDLIKSLPDGALVCADDGFMKSLGFKRAKHGRLYVVDTTARTAHVITSRLKHKRIS